MKKILITSLLCLSLFQTQAQEQQIENKNMIYFDIAPLIVKPSRVTFGYMRNINDRIFVGGEIGYSLFDGLGRMNEKSEGYEQIQYRFEVGYILSPTWRVHHFMSLDFQHINHTETLYDGYFEGENKNQNGGEVYYDYDRVNYARLKNTFNINYGVFVYFNENKSVGVAPKIGLGVKIVDVEFTEAVNLRENSNNGWDIFNFGNRYEREGSDVLPNVNFQVRFFFKF